MPDFPIVTFPWGNVLVSGSHDISDDITELDIKWGNDYNAKCSPDQLFRYGFTATSPEDFKLKLESEK